MSTTRTARPAGVSPQDLLAEIAVDPMGQVTASVYETARLVASAPWLSGHRRRIEFLIRGQNPDGTWGGPGPYVLVPTLSAVEALLTVVSAARHGERAVSGHSDVAGAVHRGLHALFARLDPQSRAVLPDTIGAEFLIPWLVGEINRHLDALEKHPVPGLDAWHGSGRLHTPDGWDSAPLDRLRHAAGQGHTLPPKVWHSLEALGGAAVQAPQVRPVGGAVGCSPAATAAWLGAGDGDGAGTERRRAIEYLHTVQARHDGPVPGVTPIGVFERAWVLSALAEAFPGTTPPRELGHSLHAAFGDLGVPAGAGLPPDSDDTAGALHALALIGRPRSPECLWAYESDTHFRCFTAERTPSTSTNAHILMAFGDHEAGAADRARYRRAIGKISQWLHGQQRPDGSWIDKWHASPYYATVCSVSALARHGDASSAVALRAATEWVLGTQRHDGSWGLWSGTSEETAYAMQTLLRAPGRDDGAVRHAVLRGDAFLAAQDDAAHRDHDGPSDHDAPDASDASGGRHGHDRHGEHDGHGHRGDTRRYPPLWHDKDLYAPVAVIRAETLAARTLTRTRILERQ